jgi:hypothetical protein
MLFVTVFSFLWTGLNCNGLVLIMFQYKDIPSNTTQTTTLTELRKYVQYHIQVLAYTRLGDGALSSPPVHVRTFEDGKLNCKFYWFIFLNYKYREVTVWLFQYKGSFTYFLSKIFFSSPNCPDCILGPPSLVFSGVWGLWPWGKTFSVWSWPLMSPSVPSWLGQEQIYHFTFKVWLWPVWTCLPVMTEYIICELTYQLSTHMWVVTNTYAGCYHAIQSWADTMLWEILVMVIPHKFHRSHYTASVVT